MPLVAPEVLFGVREAASAATVAASSVASVVRSGGGHDAAGAHGGGGGVIGQLNNTDIVILLLTFSVVLRVLNFHVFKIPSSVAMAFGSILMTVILLVLSHIPMLGVDEAVETFRSMLKDFPDLLLNYMLGFLLFAASIEVDLRNLSRILSTVLALSVVSTLLSAFMVGALTYLLMQNIAPMDFAWCLLFGAIVSPTDPVTVISILNDKPDLLPSSTKYFVIGESLLNDAVGVVLYLTLSEIVQKPDMRAWDVAQLLFRNVFVECVYGALIGVFLGWLAYSAILSVKEPLLEIVITFVLVGNINMICRILHASIPLASVGAGLFIGNYAVTFAMQDDTVETFHEIWKLADETLNSILFLMIGAADLFWNPQDLGWGPVCLLVVCTICISMVARLVAIALPLAAIIALEWLTGKRLRHESVRYRGGTLALLTWAGMRGGISIALALGVPDSFVKHAVPGHMTYGQLIFFMTFILVVFSVVVQGMLFEPVIKLITRVSFKIMPSGGLGTYVSTMSLGNGYTDFLDSDDQTHDDTLISGGERMPLWDGNSTLYGDFEAIEPSTEAPLIPSAVKDNNYLFKDDIPRRNTDMGMGIPRAESMMETYRRPGGIPTHITMVDPHVRQGSTTFENLPNLEAPPSIPNFLHNLRRRSTFSFQRLFDPRPRQENEADRSGRLRPSQTEPENLARMARGEGPGRNGPNSNGNRGHRSQSKLSFKDLS